MDTMPVIVRMLTNEEAIITMVDSNLQREHILPSEKFADVLTFEFESFEYSNRVIG